MSGQWWLPEREKHVVPGTLTIEDDGSARLLVIGEFRTLFDEGEVSVSADGQTTTVTMTQARPDAAGVYPRIVGQVGATYLTLEDCFRVEHNRNLMGGIPTEALKCGQVFHGLAFDADEALEFEGIAVGLKWLNQWMQRTSIEESQMYEQEGERGHKFRSVTLTAEPLDWLQVPYDAGTLSLGHSIGIKGEAIDSRTLEQAHFFRLDRDELVPLQELSDVASDLQDLLSIGVNLTAEFTSMELFHPQAHHEMPGGKVYRAPIDWHAQWNARDASGKTNIIDYDMIFTFNDFGGVDGVGRWMKVASDHRSSLGRVMATRYSPGMYLSDRALNRAAALERLDRDLTKSKNASFATRMRRCADLAGEPFAGLVGDVDRWVTVFKDLRDDIAHHFGRQPRGHVREQLHLADSAYWLFVLCMLRLAQAPGGTFDRLTNHRTLDWTRHGVRAAMDTYD